MRTPGEDFERYAAARWNSLVRAGVVLGCDVGQAEDLAQQTLLRCFISWSKVSGATNPDAYTYRILLNLYRDSRRRRWWGERPSAQLEEPLSPDHGELVAISHSLHRALADLGDDHRKVVVLRHLAQLSEVETAEVLGIAPGTVKSRLSRALTQLAKSPHLNDEPAGGSHDRR